MAGSGTFTKGGRIWRYETSPDGNNIGIFYEANQQEATRVSNKFGENYVGTQDGKFYVLASGYTKQSNGSFRYGPYPPGQETANGNAAQVIAIGQDVALKQQITGPTTPTTSGGPIQLPVIPFEPGTPTTPATPPGGTTPPTAPNQDQEGGSTPVTQPTTGTEPTAAMLVYPEDLGESEQDRIKFQALKYAPRRLPDNTSGQFESIKPNYDIVDIPVFLPIQSPITDQNFVGWEGDTLNPIELKAVQLSMSLMQNENMEQLQQEVAKTFTSAMKTLKKESQAVRTYLGGQAVGVNNLLSRLDGQVLNPNLELLFQGPQLRPFNFTFKMSARNRKETVIIKKIIKYFKKNMSASVGDNGLFLKAPNVFKIEYQKGRTNKHQSINLIKECALTNCSVDYTPLGSYMTYSDDEATMIAYTMTLSFQELTPVYDRDYLTGEGKDHPIGF